MLTCPWCGAIVPNECLLQNNHWVKPEDADLFEALA